MKQIFFLVLGLFLIGCIWKFSAGTIFTSTQNDNLSTYVNHEYGISLQYEREWKLNPNYSHRYDGDDGFFQINAFDGKDMDIDKVAEFQVSHKLKPFGNNPSIIKLTIQGQEARLILPSQDQVKDFENQAEVIVTYPKAIEINESFYYYFILYADKDHIQTIAKTIEFIAK